MELENKIVVVSGGLGLLGRSFVKAILRAKGIAVVADIYITVSEELVAEIKKEQLPVQNLHFHELDITSKDSVTSSIKDISSKFGKIDALVNNAYPRNAHYGRKLEEVEYTDFTDNVSKHLGGYFLCMQQYSLFFKKQGHGNIISMSSIYGVVAPRFDIYENAGFTMPVEYAAIKSGVIHLTKYFVKYFKGSNIRFNCISPGGIENHQKPDFIEKYNTYAANKGMLDKSDLNGTLVFLLSDASQFVNGQNIVVDDGWSL